MKLPRSRTLSKTTCCPSKRGAGDKRPPPGPLLPAPPRPKSPEMRDVICESRSIGFSRSHCQSFGGLANPMTTQHDSCPDLGGCIQHLSAAPSCFLPYVFSKLPAVTLALHPNRTYCPTYIPVTHITLLLKGIVTWGLYELTKRNRPVYQSEADDRGHPADPVASDQYHQIDKNRGGRPTSESKIGHSNNESYLETAHSGPIWFQCRPRKWPEAIDFCTLDVTSTRSSASSYQLTEGDSVEGV